MISASPESMLIAMFHSLLFSLVSAIFISTLFGEEGERMLKFVFLDVHFDIEGGRVTTQIVPTILSMDENFQLSLITLTP